ncbi:PspA/IM30 family protein [Niallia taxi]|uniref:PspA/IM30 family protein n=1 Tax=Niallia taxi TaxID=2499688 RepID=UPI00300A7124
MANLLERIKNAVMADINEVLDKKENKNPLALLNQYLRECEKETEKVKELVKRQYVLKEAFTKELKEAEELAAKRKKQAEIASQAGEEELFSFAQTEQNHYEERIVRLTESLKITDKQTSELEAKYAEMKHKLKDMNIRRLELMGKENMTRASYTMNKITDKQGDSAGTAKFDEMETYIDGLEKKITNKYYQQTIDEKIAALEKKIEEKKDETFTS